jgi:hypothetical protein
LLHPPRNRLNKSVANGNARGPDPVFQPPVELSWFPYLTRETRVVLTSCPAITLTR